MGLHVESLPYPEAMLNQWRRGNYKLTRELPESSFLRRILHEKIRNRIKLGRRFFGETFVATRVAHDNGWYGSFKWLSSWPATDGSPYAAEYRAALKKHFPAVSEISLSGMPLREHLEGKKPMPPDLWLFVNGAHQFIEVKLPGDSIRSSQIAGLALIATCLSGKRPVSVCVYNLYPEGHTPTPVPTRVHAQYEEFCNICRRPNPAMEPSAPSLSRARRGSSRDR
jgi:hypothetical protein